MTTVHPERQILVVAVAVGRMVPQQEAVPLVVLVL
jgi:hypothetical protein